MSIRNCRIRAGLTQAALAAACGTTQNNVARWENGGSEPRLYFLESIAVETGVTVNDLVRKDPPLMFDDAKFRRLLPDLSDSGVFAPGDIRRWEKGGRPSMRLLKEICAVCALEVSDFFKEATDDGV